MSYGLRVYSSQGDITLDTGDRVGTFLGEVEVSTNGSLAEQGFLQGVPFFIVSQSTTKPIGARIPASPLVYFSGATLIWTFPSGFTSSPCRIVYGVY